MSTRIRLARRGRRNLPFYHVVVADDRSPRDGRFVEHLGFYSPTLPNNGDGEKELGKRFTVNPERVEYWLSVGAEPTERVALLLNSIGVRGAEKFKPRIRNTSPRVKKAK